MSGRRAALAGIGLFGALGAAAQDLPRTIEPSAGHQRASAIGMASWYGAEFHGRTTADGEIFDMRSLTAAHRTMPLPSYARVTNLSNGHSIIVRVNDRGPYFGGRMIDVSARVATLLGFNRLGVTKVRLDYVGRAPPAGSDESMLLASLQTGAAPAPERVAQAGTGAPIILASLRTGDAPPAVRALVVRAPDDGETTVARVVAHAQEAEPPSPYGRLIVYPFAAEAARSPYGELVVSPFLTRAAQL